MINKMGYQEFDTVLEKGSIPLSPETFEDLANHESALVLDVRPQSDFIKGHILILYSLVSMGNLRHG